MLYLFTLGRQPEISTAELEAVFSRPLKSTDSHYAILEIKDEIDAQKLINQLGGTVKIAKDTKYEKHEITKYLQAINQNGKIEFSINDSKLAIQIKKELKNLGRSVRYIEPKNTATILHNKLVEKKSDLTIADDEIFVTEAIQPFEEFSARDYGRPGFDNKSGMLPPKLAKIMINLAVETQNFASLQNTTILDPFCGSGTILTEAAVMGYTNLIGSDISEKAISDTKKNLDWIKKSYKLQDTSYKLYNIDVTKLGTLISASSIDRIITEPYLGLPLHGNETENYLKKQIAELKNLYVNSFKEFYKILKPNGIVVFIIPRFKYKNDWEKIDCVEEIKKIGFEIVPFAVETQNFASLQYHRPNQHLAREIWRFKKNCRT